MATKRRVRVHVGWMIARQLPAVVDIERSRDGTRTRDDFIEFLRDRSTVGMTAEVRGRVVGFLVYRLHRDRIEVLDLVVDPMCEGRGVGTALLAKAVDKVKSHRRSCLTLPGGLTVAADPRWVSDDVRSLLGNDGTPVQVLADALEEAGCGDARLLELFRRGGAMAGEVRRLVRRQLLGDE